MFQKTSFMSPGYSPAWPEMRKNPPRAQSPIFGAEEGVPADNPRKLTAWQALRILMTGNQLYWQDKKTPTFTIGHQKDIAEATNPIAVVLSCMDPRKAAPVIFNLDGEHQVYSPRNAGARIVREALADIRLACKGGQIPLIMVLGHHGQKPCAAAADALENYQEPEPASVALDLQPAVFAARAHEGFEQKDPTAQVNAVSRENVLRGVETLENDPVIGDLIRTRQVKVVGALFNTDTGEVTRVRRQNPKAARQSESPAFQGYVA